MNLEELKKKLQPTLVPYKIEGMTIFIHRPTVNDMDKCVNTPSTLIHCVKDENGMAIFSNEDLDGRININLMDSIELQKIYLAVVDLFNDSDPMDEVEKK